MVNTVCRLSAEGPVSSLRCGVAACATPPSPDTQLCPLHMPRPCRRCLRLPPSPTCSCWPTVLRALLTAQQLAKQWRLKTRRS